MSSKSGTLKGGKMGLKDSRKDVSRTSKALDLLPDHLDSSLVRCVELHHGPRGQAYSVAFVSHYSPRYYWVLGKTYVLQARCSSNCRHRSCEP